MMLRAVIMRGALLCLLWWVLTGGSFYGWAVGLITIGLALVTSLRLQPPRNSRISVLGLLAFFFFFMAKSIKGGVQVAAIALQPRLQLQPAMLELRLRLPDEAQRVFLVSTLSLLPGTLSTGLDGNRLQLHVLDARMPIEQEVRNAEERVARMFGTVLR